MTQANKVVDFAKSQVGYKETPTNINKYAAEIDKDFGDFYNGKKQGAAWCDVFVDYCFIKCFGEAEALRLLCQPKKSTGAGTVYSYGFYKKNKQVGKIPRVGSQIFFGKTEKGINHTGLVIDVKGGKVFTIEGNKNNQVAACTYDVNDSSIYGYGYPAYEDSEKDDDVIPAKEGIVMIEMPALERGAKGEAVKTLQILLNNKFGERLDIDGSFGLKTYNSVCKYQRAKNLQPVDGYVGAGTWNALLK